MTISAAEGANLQPARDRSSRNRPARLIGFVFILIALATSVGTFLVLTGQTAIEPTQQVILTARWLNAFMVLLLIIMIAYEIGGLIVARRKGRAAARLHVRIVALFSFIATFPAVLMAILASATIDRGLDQWFNERTQAIVNTSVIVAQSYLQEHRNRLAGDLLAIAAEFNRVSPDITKNKETIASYMTNQARLRSLSAIRIVRQDGTVVVEGNTPVNKSIPPPPPDALVNTDPVGKPILIEPKVINLVGGVVQLVNLEDMFLYVARPIDRRVTRHVSLTEESAREFNQLEANRADVQEAFAILFTGMALVVLLSAIWLGLGFANRLVAPIRHLITAAGEISEGNLDVRVPVRESTGDIGSLSSTFNTMTDQLKSQRNELLTAYEKLDERRRFTEAVLSGVSASVIGLDGNGIITLVNPSILETLMVREDEMVGKPIREVLPEIEPLLEKRTGRRRGESRGQIQIVRDGEPRTLNVKITEENVDHIEEGLVVTLDDITDLMAAQRRSAWADVARRIAHEIKNPLTPIQLSAERIRRRYGKTIAEEDKAVFDQCTDTIVRQVGDIRRMVDEFSSFARMPKPVMQVHDLNQVVREAVFLQEVGNPDIEFTLEAAPEPVMAYVDNRLIAQALINIIKNASEALEGMPAAETGPNRIVVRVFQDDHAAYVEVEDNGKGFPKEQRDRLLEPYMTTREKGTGLGLAIVRKIMEEHEGTISLNDADSDEPGRPGAKVRLGFVRRSADGHLPDAQKGETPSEED
jgi:two-component system nitrogen regulation sensor histidine kinase NtrY